MVKEISDFVSKVRILTSLADIFYVLKYNAEKKADQQAISILDQAYEAIQAVNLNIPQLITSLIESQENSTLYLSQLRESLTVILGYIKNISDDFVPNKEELLALISSSIECFSEKNMITITNILKRDRSEISKEILSLEDLCEKDF